MLKFGAAARGRPSFPLPFGVCESIPSRAGFAYSANVETRNALLNDTEESGHAIWATTSVRRRKAQSAEFTALWKGDDCGGTDSGMRRVRRAAPGCRGRDRVRISVSTSVQLRPTVRVVRQKVQERCRERLVVATQLALCLLCLLGANVIHEDFARGTGFHMEPLRFP